MANYDKALSEILDVVEHLVGTHVRWNLNLSHDMATAKVAAARVHLAATDVENVAEDVETGDAAGAVTDGVKLVTDALNKEKNNG